MMGRLILLHPERSPGPNPAGRRCAHPDCITILHTRHDGDRCYAHAPAPQITALQQRLELIDLMAELPDTAA